MPLNPNYPELTAAQAQWRYTPTADCLAGQTILVTGAGAGIGATASKTFACYGANVVLLGRTRSHLENVSDWISQATDTQPVIVPCDLEQLGDENAGALAEAIEDSFGKLDGLLHNASMLGPKVPIHHYNTDEWRRVFAVNVHAAQSLTRALFDLMQASTAPSIVFTSSSVGRQGRAFWGAYAASKFAVEGLMQTLADETEGIGQFRVNSLNPGGTRTAMRASAYPAEDPVSVPTAETHMDLYLYLFSALSRGITGHAFDARDWTPADIGPGQTVENP